MKAFPLRSGPRQTCPLSPLLFNIILEVLAMAIRDKKEMKEIQTGKEVKLTLFADDMILYIENPKVASRKLLDLINKFGKVSEYKINTEKSLVFLYSNNKKSEIETKETISFTIASKTKTKQNKISRNKPKEAKVLYSENYKILMKETKDDTNR